MTAKKHTYLLFYGSLLLLIWILAQSERIAEAVRASLVLCAHALIPALAAPIVISGILSALSTDVRLPGGRIFSRVFHLPESGFSPFLLGILCGFPIGAKVSAELYRAGAYNKSEAARIAALASNTGPAFAVAGVGLAFFKSARIGWFLYMLQLFSAVALGILDGRKHPLPPVAKESKSAQGGILLSDILYRSSLSLLTVCGTVVFFGAICALPSGILPDGVTAALGAILEVGNGTYRASRLSRAIGVPLAAFSIAFSGTSVLFQNASHLTPEGIPMEPVIYRKLCQGILAFLFSLFFSPLLK